MNEPQKKYDFFISYPHKEREWVRRFVEALEQHNLKIWYDEKIIPLVAEDVPIGELVSPIRRRRWVIKGDPVVNADEVARSFSENGNGATPAVSELAAAS
jgi:hypothetical protein